MTPFSPHQLTSNGFALAASAGETGRLVPSAPAQPVAELREQYEAQGYLWLKGLLDRDEVLAFRRRYFEAFAETGLLAPGTDPADGLYSGLPAPNVNRLLVEIVRWAAYEAFCRRGPSGHFTRHFSAARLTCTSAD
jgi:hypothetical protein